MHIPGKEDPHRRLQNILWCYLKYFSSRHHESKTIRQHIQGDNLKKDQVDKILKKMGEGHYQIACGMHYSALHLKELTTGSVCHPNQWYLESRGLGVGGEAGSMTK